MFASLSLYGVPINSGRVFTPSQLHTRFWGSYYLKLVWNTFFCSDMVEMRRLEEAFVEVLRTLLRRRCVQKYKFAQLQQLFWSLLYAVHSLQLFCWPRVAAVVVVSAVCCIQPPVVLLGASSPLEVHRCGPAPFYFFFLPPIYFLRAFNFSFSLPRRT